MKPLEYILQFPLPYTLLTAGAALLLQFKLASAMDAKKITVKEMLDEEAEEEKIVRTKKGQWRISEIEKQVKFSDTDESDIEECTPNELPKKRRRKLREAIAVASKVIGTKLSVDYRLHDERSDWRAAAACYILSRHIQEGSSERKWVITEGCNFAYDAFKKNPLNTMSLKWLCILYLEKATSCRDDKKMVQMFEKLQGIIDMAIKNRPKDPELLHIRGKLQVCMLARAPPKQLPYGLKKHFELADKDLEKARDRWILTKLKGLSLREHFIMENYFYSTFCNAYLQDHLKLIRLYYAAKHEEKNCIADIRYHDAITMLS